MTGVPEDVRIIVAGQDLVRDGDKVEVVAARRGQPNEDSSKPPSPMPG